MLFAKTVSKQRRMEEVVHYGALELKKTLLKSLPSLRSFTESANVVTRVCDLKKRKLFGILCNQLNIIHVFILIHMHLHVLYIHVCTMCILKGQPRFIHCKDHSKYVL